MDEKEKEEESGAGTTKKKQSTDAAAACRTGLAINGSLHTTILKNLLIFCP